MPRDAVSTIYVRVWHCISHRIAFSFQIRANTMCVDIIIHKRNNSYARSIVNMMQMNYGRDIRWLSWLICFGSNGMFKLLLFKSMIYEKRNRCTACFTASIQYVANILVELKPAKNFNKFF